MRSGCKGAGAAEAEAAGAGVAATCKSNQTPNPAARPQARKECAAPGPGSAAFAAATGIKEGWAGLGKQPRRAHLSCSTPGRHTRTRGSLPGLSSPTHACSVDATARRTLLSRPPLIPLLEAPSEALSQLRAHESTHRPSTRTAASRSSAAAIQPNLFHHTSNLCQHKTSYGSICVVSWDKRLNGPVNGHCSKASSALQTLDGASTNGHMPMLMKPSPGPELPL